MSKEKKNNINDMSKFLVAYDTYENPSQIGLSIKEEILKFLEPNVTQKRLLDASVKNIKSVLMPEYISATDKDLFFVAKLPNGKIIGFSYVKIIGDITHHSVSVVHQEFRGYGIGEHLIQVKKNKVLSMVNKFTTTVSNNNIASIISLMRAGFIVIGIRQMSHNGKIQLELEVNNFMR